MTVIAWDGMYVVADKLMAYGDTIIKTTKLRICDGRVLAWNGDSWLAGARIDWMLNNKKLEEFPLGHSPDDSAEIIVFKEGNVFLFQQGPIPIPIEADYFACGSGMNFAITALELGLGAIEAVRLACKLDTGCGVGYDIIDLTKPLKITTFYTEEWKP